ncbi:MAG: hypothetical protein O6942_05120 [Bacteroidetes bacterium]|nr:hypothetical protein [Bacteroidota bacterium]
MVRTTDMVIDCRRDKKPYPLREYTKLIENRGTLKLTIFSPEQDDSYRALTVVGMTIDLSYAPLSAVLRAPVR